MKKTILLLALLFAALATQAQEKRELGNFTGVSVTGSFDVTLTKGKPGIRIDASPEAFQSIKTEISNGTLQIYKQKNGKSYGEIHIEVSYEALDFIALNGSGGIKTNGALSAQLLRTHLMGSGDIDLQLDANQIEADLNGSGNLRLLGKGNKLKATLTGSGDLDTTKLTAANVEMHVIGSGDAKVFASQAIVAKVDGSGSIDYSGNPKTEDTKVNGSGNINAR